MGRGPREGAKWQLEKKTKKKGGGAPEAHTQRGRAKGHSDHQAIRLTYKP